MGKIGKLALGLALVVSFGCAHNGPAARIDQADRAAFSALRAFQTTETALYRQGAP